MGEVDLLHNDNGVPLVPLQEVYAETRPSLRPHLTPIYWSILRPHLVWNLILCVCGYTTEGGSTTELPSQHRTMSSGGPQTTLPSGLIHSMGTEPAASDRPGR